MHRQFRKLLENATGISQYIVAINLDIRGFTPFCQTVDSVEVATYIAKVYMKIIDDYFSNVSFYKPTGDGLLLVIGYDEESLKEIVNSTVKSCLKLLEDFEDLCKGEAMINFPTPSKIGIGITRGSACCITSEEKILDYSGKVLNLASRLMDIARPSGIVLDSGLGIDLLPHEEKELFLEDAVYVRGIAEEEPITVYYTKEYTLISGIHKYPIKEPKWKKVTHAITLKDFKHFDLFVLPLKYKPLDARQIRIEISFDHVKKYITSYCFSVGNKEVYYEMTGKKHEIIFAVPPLAKKFEKAGVTDNMEITFEIDYPTK